MADRERGFCRETRAGENGHGQLANRTRKVAQVSHFRKGWEKR